MARMMSISGRIGRSLAWIPFGFVLGVIAIYTQGPGAPPLEPWHTEELAAEFTVQSADEIRTFDDYRRVGPEYSCGLPKVIVV